MPMFIHKLLLRFRPFRKHYLDRILEEIDVSNYSTAAKVEFAQCLLEDGYIRNAEEYIDFLNRI